MRYFLFFILTLHLFAVDATLRIEKDVEQRARVSLIDGSSPSSISDKFFNTMVSDFKISGHFLPDTTHHRGSIDSGMIPPSLKSKDIVVKYNLIQSSGLKIVIKIFKASDSSLIATKDYSISSVNKYPFLAHKAVSEINNILRFPSVDWLNRYVVFSRYTGAKRSVIILADYTMQYQKSVIRGGLNLFPKWADAKQSSFYYTSFNGAIPTLYRLNIYNGSKSRITSSQGMLVCSDVSPNGSKILLTMAPNGQPDIYEMSLSSRSTRRLTNFAGIDVGGKYLGSGAIAFVSNRLGYANVFKKSLGGGSVSQLVHRGRNNNSVDANGNKVVYSSRESSNSFSANAFSIYMTNSNGSGTRPLTTTGVNQFPRFSSNGDTILYVKHYNNRSSIGYINLSSKQTMLFPLGGKVQSIDW
ncbi:tolB protein precursor, periplasmic protein involved in the tonb-independent uptake of group A colicins [hydrothermal vent metagenome]|uniref:TolB protein, periplasmic protein involved in the tonb-independent uptake of group A colicins n=1 Tax=hydrothermal vent metagenome TaxID=652676 RepID=A0A1W1C6S8_9ZZZZ